MNRDYSPPAVAAPSRVRFGVLGFACTLAMITYLDRVCFGTVAPYIKREFGFSNTEMGLIFSAFAFAYAAFEVPTGWLGDRFGPRKTLIRIVVWWSVFTALTGLVFPLQGDLHWLAFAMLLGVRFLFGIGEAGAFPNIAKAFHNWIPFTERGTAQGSVWMAGRLMGGLTSRIVIALLFIPAINIAGSAAWAVGRVGLEPTPLVGGELALAFSPPVAWRHIFFIFGAIGCVWCVLFWWWFRDRPEDKGGVNSGELALIHAGRTAADMQSHEGVPWLKLMTNGNLWILCIQYFCGAYGWYFNITYLPGYLTSRYGVSPMDPQWGAWTFSFMAGAPLLFGSVACLAGGVLTDMFIRRTGNRKWGRRLFGVIGHGTCGICYLAAPFAPNPWLFVLAISLAAFCNDMTMGSAWASCIDIGRKYSGIVSGCMNTVGNMGGALAGVLTGFILDRFHNSQVGGWQADDVGWHYNFLSFGGLYFLAVVMWMLFDSTKSIIRDDDGKGHGPTHLAAGPSSDKIMVKRPELPPDGIQK